MKNICWNKIYIEKLSFSKLFTLSSDSNIKINPWTWVLKVEITDCASTVSLSFILMNAYPQSNDSSDHEFLLAELKYIDCLIRYKPSSVLNGTLSRHYFPSNMKQY